MLTKTELNDKNLIKAINTKVMPDAQHPMNVYKFAKVELNELNISVKKELRKFNILWKQSSDDERLYL